MFAVTHGEGSPPAGVAVGSAEPAFGWRTGVAVGGTGVAVGGIGVAVGGTGVGVGARLSFRTPVPNRLGYCHVVVGGRPPGQLGVPIAAVVVVVDLHLQAELAAVGDRDAQLRHRDDHLHDVTGATGHKPCLRAGRHGRRVGPGDHGVAVGITNGELKVVDAVVDGCAAAVVTVNEDLDGIVGIPGCAAVVDAASDRSPAPAGTGSTRRAAPGKLPTGQRPARPCRR